MKLLDSLLFVASHPLNRGQKARSLWRFCKWQIASRLAPGAIVYDWIDGAQIIVGKGEAGLTGNVYTGLHEFSDMAYLLHVLRAGDLFVDVGANAGSYTVLACSVVGARGYAFEPVPETHRRLVKNLRLNCLDDKVVHPNVAIGSAAGQLSFTADGDTVNHVLAEGEACSTAVTVDVTTLDRVLSKESPALIKIDVEGFEAQVLRGAAETLAKSSLHSLIIELNGSGDRYGFDESSILELMSDHAFRAYSYEPLCRTLIELSGINPGSGNTLFIRDRDFVDERLRTAEEITVNNRSF